MRLLICLALLVGALMLTGCAKSDVSSSDVKGWQQAHDANGNPVKDEKSPDGR